MDFSSKKRVATALSHKSPDKVPVDFGGTGVTGIHVSCVEKLRKHYGLEQHPVKISECFQCLGEIEEDLAKVLGSDTANVFGRYNSFGVKNENWKPWTTPWGQDVLIPGDFNLTKDDNGNIYTYPQGDTSVRPSGKMPASSYFFDALIRGEELAEDDEDLKVSDNTEEFTLLSDEDLDEIEKSVNSAYNTGRSVVKSFGQGGLGDIAQVPGISLKNPKGIRDITEWYISTISRKDFIKEIFESQMETAIKNLEKINNRCGDKIDIIMTCGTDFGTQRGTFCSVETFRDLYVPYYKKLNGWIKENTNWKIFKHCCGSVVTLIPDFIDCGFDILNPVQCSAEGMDPLKLKTEFGKDITFWGAGVDTQKTLPFGTPEEVRKEVLSRCEIFGKDGGFVFNTIHNLQAGTPLENIVAMMDALKEFNA